MSGKPRTASEANEIAGSAFEWNVRVYYEDTDAAGVVYYANYLKFMERARTEWLRALPFDPTALAREQNVIFVVRAASIEYLQPARLNDELHISAELASARGCLIELVQSVRRGALVLVSAEVKLACVNKLSFRPVRIPAAILDTITMRKA